MTLVWISFFPSGLWGVASEFRSHQFVSRTTFWSPPLGGLQRNECVSVWMSRWGGKEPPLAQPWPAAAAAAEPGAAAGAAAAAADGASASAAAACSADAAAPAQV